MTSQSRMSSTGLYHQVRLEMGKNKGAMWKYSVTRDGENGQRRNNFPLVARWSGKRRQTTKVKVVREFRPPSMTLTAASRQ